MISVECLAVTVVVALAAIVLAWICADMRGGGDEP
jgi:hypothetical protein